MRNWKKLLGHLYRKKKLKQNQQYGYYQNLPVFQTAHTLKDKIMKYNHGMECSINVTYIITQGLQALQPYFDELKQDNLQWQHSSKRFQQVIINYWGSPTIDIVCSWHLNMDIAVAQSSMIIQSRWSILFLTYPQKVNSSLMPVSLTSSHHISILSSPIITRRMSTVQCNILRPHSHNYYYSILSLFYY